MKQYCKNHKKSIIKYRKNYNLKRNYNINIEQKNKMILNQNNKCLSCGKIFKNSKNTHIDHDHKTKNVRGVLCAWCNGALGMLGEDLKKIYKLANYIKKYCK